MLDFVTFGAHHHLKEAWLNAVASVLESFNSLVNHETSEERPHSLDNFNWYLLVYSVVPVEMQSLENCEQVILEKSLIWDSHFLEHCRSNLEARDFHSCVNAD